MKFTPIDCFEYPFLYTSEEARRRPHRHRKKMQTSNQRPWCEVAALTSAPPCRPLLVITSVKKKQPCHYNIIANFKRLHFPPKKSYYCYVASSHFLRFFKCHITLKQLQQLTWASGAAEHKPHQKTQIKKRKYIKALVNHEQLNDRDNRWRNRNRLAPIFFHFHFFFCNSVHPYCSLYLLAV